MGTCGARVTTVCPCTAFDLCTRLLTADSECRRILVAVYRVSMHYAVQLQHASDALGTQLPRTPWTAALVMAFPRLRPCPMRINPDPKDLLCITVLAQPWPVRSRITIGTKYPFLNMESNKGARHIRQNRRRRGGDYLSFCRFFLRTLADSVLLDAAQHADAIPNQH
jgi:hypothetical protein